MKIMEILMFRQTFLSPQVKRCAIITYTHGISELPNASRLRILGNGWERPKPHRMIAQPPAKIKALPIPEENSRKIEIKPPPPRHPPENQSQPRHPASPPPQTHTRTQIYRTQNIHQHNDSTKQHPTNTWSPNSEESYAELRLSWKKHRLQKIRVLYIRIR